jgi:hypothetical protein
MKETIDGVLQDATYTDSKVGQWNNAIVEACIERLTNLNKAYKYVGARVSSCNRLDCTNENYVFIHLRLL